MTTNKVQGSQDVWGLLLAAVLILGTTMVLVAAQPQGATINSASTEGSPTNPPDSRNDSGGTINVLVLNTLQQNNKWKGYVGNVTGRLTLDDASGNTIYDWSLAASDVDGEVYVARNDSIQWGSIQCANSSTISSEESFLGMASSASDSLNNTFNYTAHRAMDVGIITLNNNTCRSTATYVNDSRQAINQNSSFQEILLQDSNQALVYATFIDQDTSSYKNDTPATYDFQLIVGNDQSVTTTYYFYLEIG